MRLSIRRFSAYSGAAVAVLALGMASCTTPGGGGGGGGALAAAGEIGPNPTEASLLSSRGPFQTRSQSANGAGFNNGTIYVPTDTSLGRMAAIVVVPGFISNKSSIEWYGPRLASWGFVVMTINTNTPLDFPAQRSGQQLAALQWLSTQSPVADRVDGERWGAMGWSMGGGGSLDSIRREGKVKAAVPLAPWNISGYAGMDKRALMVTCQGDVVAPPATMGGAWYNGIAGEKALLGVPGGHFCVTNSNNQIGKFAVAWMKRWLDGDTRFDQFICSNAALGYNYRNTCPMSG